MKTVAENLTSVVRVAGVERSHGEVGDTLKALADSLRRRAMQYRLAAALAEISRDASMFADLANMFSRLASHLDSDFASSNGDCVALADFGSLRSVPAPRDPAEVSLP